MLARLIINNSASRRLFSTSPGRFGQIFNIQDAKDFEAKVIKSKDPVIVDFYADWCGPCRLLAPKLETRIGQEKNVHLAKVNVDNLDELAAQHQVSTIPHVVGYKDGKQVDKFIGNKDNDIINEFVKKLSCT
uniref:Thioredoxin, mitochondrial n=1 Tax=Aceria tosichella TaxID=561515 RepID=A0A6G1SIN6_9ACAR